MHRFVYLGTVSLLVLFNACASVPQPTSKHAMAEPERRDASFEPQATARLRVLLVGDSGHPGEDVQRVRRAMMKEDKDVIVALGDLAYPLVPECPSGRAEGAAKESLDLKLGSILGGLGAPVLLVLGNHDIPRGVSGSAQEACLIDYAAQTDDFVLPQSSYTVDYGVAILAIANTQALRDQDAATIARSFNHHSGWKVGLGHHVYKTYHDKTDEDIVRPWLNRHGIAPDVWGNGHAHILQLGIYDGIVAITSGSASLKRDKPACPGECGPGQLFGSSEPGYAVAEFTPQHLIVTFKDAMGTVLHTYKVSKGELRGMRN